jgi:hypothetical protein
LIANTLTRFQKLLRLSQPQRGYSQPRRRRNLAAVTHILTAVTQDFADVASSLGWYPELLVWLLDNLMSGILYCHSLGTLFTNFNQIQPKQSRGTFHQHKTSTKPSLSRMTLHQITITTPNIEESELRGSVYKISTKTNQHRDEGLPSTILG